MLGFFYPTERWLNGCHVELTSRFFQPFGVVF